MKDWVKAIIVILLVVVFPTVLTNKLIKSEGYLERQRDALQGIYRITQAERDSLDPEGLHHHKE